MLRAENGRLPRNRGITRLMNAPLAIRRNAKFAHGLQTLDNPGKVFEHWPLGPFAQPCERRAPMIAVDSKQILQRRDCVFGQPFDKVLVGAFARKRASRQGDFFQDGWSRQQNALLLQIRDHRGNDCVPAIRTGRLFDCDMNNCAHVFAPERTHGKIGLQFAEMRTTCLLPFRIFFKRIEVVSNLRPNEGKHVRRRGFIDADHPARKTQVGETHGEAEPIRGAPALTDQREVFRREGVMPHDRRRVCRRIEQRSARLRGEDVARGHGQAQ